MNTLEPLRTLGGLAAALPLPNLDTDQIMPKQFLRGIDKAGLAQGLFHDMRFDGNGRPREDFVLNRPAFARTRILVAGPNFGCGSSREHAVWGLMQAGITAVVAPSFGEIFYSNALNNRLLAAQVDADAGHRLLQLTDTSVGVQLQIDIAARRLRAGDETFDFALSGRHQAMFLQGLDLIGTTLADMDAIRALSQARARSHPWLHGLGAKVRQRTLEAAR